MTVGGERLLLAEEPPHPAKLSADSAADPFRTFRLETGVHLSRGKYFAADFCFTIFVVTAMRAVEWIMVNKLIMACSGLWNLRQSPKSVFQ